MSRLTLWRKVLSSRTQSSISARSHLNTSLALSLSGCDISIHGLYIPVLSRYSRFPSDACNLSLIALSCSLSAVSELNLEAIRSFCGSFAVVPLPRVLTVLSVLAKISDAAVEEIPSASLVPQPHGGSPVESGHWLDAN